jgi:ribosomal protein S18 acetylase RimI-like enzyme
MTRLDRLDGPATAAPPFHETEVEAGFFADELEEPGFRCWVASEDDLLRDAVGQGPDGAGRWLEGQFAVVWIAVRPERRGRGIGRTLLERLLASAGTDRAWLITHDLDTPAQALYRSLGFQQLGRGPLGWHDAERVVLGTDLPPER